MQTEGNLHQWFRSKSKDGKGGWVNVVTGGTCAMSMMVTMCIII